MTTSKGANGPARGNGSAKGPADGPADADAPALDRPWAHGPAAAELTDADDATIEENLRLASGGAAPVLAWQTLSELAAAACLGAGYGARHTADGADGAGHADGGLPVFAAVEAALALAPRDPLEGMLAAQMAAVHGAAMRCLVRAAECAGHPKIEALYLRLAARLLNLFVRQAEALDRRARTFRGPDGQGWGSYGPSAGGRAGAGGGEGNGAARGPANGGCDLARGADGAAGMEGGDEEPQILARAVDACRSDEEARRRERENAAGEGECETHRTSGGAVLDGQPGGGPDP